MATQTTSISVTGSFTLTDSSGNIVFTFAPSFTTDTTTAGAVISTGEVLTDGTSDTTINLARHHKDAVFAFIKNVDGDYFFKKMFSKVISLNQHCVHLSHEGVNWDGIQK